MARVLIVGCGCRGRELARELVRRGHAVRGTTRSEARLEEIEAAGGEAVVADPDRLSTVMPHVAGASVVCWLMGAVVGEPEVVAAVHGPRLETLLERLVDTPVRGVVYEAAGPVQRRWLDQGAALVRAAGARYRMPVEVVDADPRDPSAWTAAVAAAVERVLGA